MGVSTYPNKFDKSPDSLDTGLLGCPAKHVGGCSGPSVILGVYCGRDVLLEKGRWTGCVGYWVLDIRCLGTGVLPSVST